MAEDNISSKIKTPYLLPLQLLLKHSLALMQPTEPVNLLLILATDFILIIGGCLIRLCELRVGQVSFRARLWRGLSRLSLVGVGLPYAAAPFGCLEGGIWWNLNGGFVCSFVFGLLFCPRCGLVGLRV